jgi:hypothetical protein
MCIWLCFMHSLTIQQHSSVLSQFIKLRDFSVLFHCHCHLDVTSLFHHWLCIQCINWFNLKQGVQGYFFTSVHKFFVQKLLILFCFTFVWVELNCLLHLSQIVQSKELQPPNWLPPLSSYDNAPVLNPCKLSQYYATGTTLENGLI